MELSLLFEFGFQGRYRNSRASSVLRSRLRKSRSNRVNTLRTD